MSACPILVVPNTEAGLSPSVAEWLALGGCSDLDVIPWMADEGGAMARLQKSRGLILLGGGDLAPESGAYADRLEADGVSLRLNKVERDGLELFLVRKAWELGIGILGLCRGFQVINVALGGTIVPDMVKRWGSGRVIPEHDLTVQDMAVTRGNGDRWHPIEVTSGGLLGECVEGRSEITVVSHHHQALDRVATSLIVDGWARDGVVESFYAYGRSHVVGVQSHPERQPDDPWGLRWLKAWRDKLRHPEVSWTKRGEEETG
jgi:putative glutamine amidotransferase